MRSLSEIKDIWAEPTNYSPTWGTRAGIAASFVAPGSIVCDIGCGALEQMKRHLPDGCVYLPADMKRWHDGVEDCDLNAGRFPLEHIGQCSVISMLGVLEYIADAKAALAMLSVFRKHMIFSYFPADVRTQFYDAWVSTITTSDILVTLADAGYSNVQTVALPDRQFVFSAHQA